MIATKSYSKPKNANLKKVDKPFYGLKSYQNENRRTVHAVRKKSTADLKLPKIAPWKVIMATIIIGSVGFLYLTHVFSTQEILKEVTDLRRQHEAALRIHAEHTLTYDRKTGPAQIYQLARSQGFIHGGAADPIIRIEK